MAVFDAAAQVVHCKIVYFGPGHAGKSSSLRYIYDQIPPTQRSEFRTIATETERTLAFDFTPLDAPVVRGYSVRLQLWTVPRAVLYERTRVAILEGADGVVFVADSQRDKLQENIKSLQELARAITNQGRKFGEFPLVLQYNKRDILTALPLHIMDKYLRPPPFARQRYDTVATIGIGVLDTLNAIRELVLAKLAAQEPG